MARFIAEITNERGNQVHRLGHHTLGVILNGWNSGISVRATKREDNTDEFCIYLTKGSNDAYARELLAIVHNGERVF